MGKNVSSLYAKARSDAIDCQLEVDSGRFRQVHNVLLLGLSGSGKSTIVKQMQITHQNGFTNEELMTYRPTIYQNTLESAQAIVLAMHKIGLNWVHPSNNVNADRIFDYRIEPSPSFVFSPEIAKAIHQLWNDPIIPRLMDRGSDFYVMENAIYFFTDVLRIGSPNYLPTENDVLQAHAKTTGITETWFMAGQVQLRILDLGVQCSQRRKWIHCFDGITSILFCAALSDYDQMMLGKKNQNRVAESLLLFESVINSRWFLRTSIILFLNKVDVFRAKLPKVPLKTYFPEYSGGADINKAAKYILWKFLQTNCARLSIYPHLTQATATTNVHLLFAAMRETIHQNRLKGSNIL